jgi:Fic family protein
LVNYVDALDLVDRRLGDGLVVDGDFLEKLHGAVTKGLGRDEDPHFKPHHEGKWRDGIARVVDRLSGTVMHEGPPAVEVEGRMEGLFSWLDRKAEMHPPFVLAVVAHYAITDIHPFADGNGRVARLLQASMLMRADVLPGRMFSFERYYAEDRPAYYRALRSVRENTFNMEQWLHYALAGLGEEYDRVGAKVAELSELAFGDATTLQLNSSQQRGLTRLRSEGRREFARVDYEVAAGIGRTTAVDDLQSLHRHGVVRVLGRGPATRYAFPGAPGVRTTRQGAGRPREWTDERIERELRSFLAGNPVGWPSHEDFRAAGRGGLYAAASRNGGIRRWRRVLGR